MQSPRRRAGPGLADTTAANRDRGLNKRPLSVHAGPAGRLSQPRAALGSPQSTGARRRQGEARGLGVQRNIAPKPGHMRYADTLQFALKRWCHREQALSKVALAEQLV